MGILYLHACKNTMTKQIIFFLLILFSLNSCVERRDLSINTVVNHITIQPDGLHPYNDNSSIRSFVFQYTQKTVTKLDLVSLEYIPQLAKELPIISEDGLAYTYELHGGIKWDDGTPLTAEDVVFSTKVMLCPLTNNAQIRSNYTTVIKSVVVDKENPLKFTMYAHDVNYTNADETQLSRVFINLIKNSIESIYDKISKNVDFKGKINIDIRSDSDYIYVVIVDNGVGFGHIDKTKMLSPYFTTKKKGTGLGLAIVGKIISDHNSVISFNSIDKGAKVEVIMPNYHV
mgnify:CR=1 FL=1